jgi:hypothetical protein
MPRHAAPGRDRVDLAVMHADRVTEPVPFAHASEAELARILDYYGIAWAYEPYAFPILWNVDGAVVESFAPDFYLPDLDLYIELTTLKQSLVRKKNRKLRRLRELYPDVQIKLFYARDFRALMLKYGRIELVDSLSGAEGQATPPRHVAGTGRSPAGAVASSAMDERVAGASQDASREPATPASRRRRRAARRAAAVQEARA